MTQNDPFARLPQAPTFTLTSDTLTDGGVAPLPHWSAIFGVPGGADRSPHLAWSGAPDGTRSYVVTVYDPDAPTGSGFWHWVLADIPVGIVELSAGSGDRERGGTLPAGARTFRNDAGMTRFPGFAPPAGHGPHRYVVVVNALDIDRLDVPDDASAAMVGFTLGGHLLGRAVLTVTAEA